MGLKLEIELERLREPAVAAAVARLIEVLGGALPRRRRRRRARRACGRRARRARGRTGAAAGAAAPQGRRAPPGAAPAADPARSARALPRERYLEFVEQLPKRSRDFLDLVRDRKLLKISDAMRELDVDAPKAMGGLTGSIGRWAPLRGVQIPYEATTQEGERAWRWVGGPGADEGDEGDEGGTPAAPASVGPPPAALIAALKEGGHDKSVQFLEMLYTRGALERGEVLQALGLAAPKSIGGVTEPVNRAVRELGIEPAFRAAKDADKKRIWLAPGAAVPAGVTVDD
ncbi:MAG: hypothetical protein R3F60_03905 [bacterium]